MLFPQAHKTRDQINNRLTDNSNYEINFDMHSILNDPIDVVVSFVGKRVVPSVIRWMGKAYNIKQITMIHSAQEGRKKLFYFSVTDSANFFKLQFDAEILEWRLVELYTEA